MAVLLDGDDPTALVALLIGFYSVGLADRLRAAGLEVITCDYRHSEGPGMHYLGDCREILHARLWTVIVACPPCKNLTWATTCEYGKKRANGEQWYSLAFCILLYTANAIHIWLEQPGSCLAKFLRPPDIMFHPRDLSDEETEQKLTMLWVVNGAIPALEGNGLGEWQRSHLARHTDANLQEMERSRFAEGTNEAIAVAVVTTVNSNSFSHDASEIASCRLPFATVLAQVAERYTAAGYPLPDDWDNAQAIRPGGDQSAELALGSDGKPKHRPAHVDQAEEAWEQQQLPSECEETSEGDTSSQMQARLRQAVNSFKQRHEPDGHLEQVFEHWLEAADQAGEAFECQSGAAAPGTTLSAGPETAGQPSSSGLGSCNETCNGFGAFGPNLDDYESMQQQQKPSECEEGQEPASHTASDTLSEAAGDSESEEEGGGSRRWLMAMLAGDCQQHGFRQRRQQ